MAKTLVPKGCYGHVPSAVVIPWAHQKLLIAKKAAGEGLRRRLSDAEVRSFLSLQNRDISV